MSDAPVKVKPLAWDGGEFEAKSYAHTGVYIIGSGWKDRIGGTRWYAWLHTDTEDDSYILYFHGKEAESIDAAKAAAQADHESRILSAIDTAAMADLHRAEVEAARRDGRVAGLREAGEIARSPTIPVFYAIWTAGQDAAAIIAMCAVSRAILARAAEVEAGE